VDRCRVGAAVGALLNRGVERWRHLRAAGLRARACAVAKRLPLVIVPGMFGCRLVDGRGRLLWGSTWRLYRGPPIARAEGARPDGVIDGLALVPGLLDYDVHGGLLRFLEEVGGYRRRKDLFTFTYDWRAGVMAGAGALAAFLATVPARVDLLGISTGGQLVRWLLGDGGAARVRRAIYLGGPQRGTFDALASLHRGFRFAPGGKHFTGAEAALCQTTLDALPHPDEPLFVDRAGRPLGLDLFDAAVWRRLGLGPHGSPGLDEGLARARRLHRRLDALSDGAARAAGAAVDSFVIGARHLPTPARVVVDGDRAWVPPPVPPPDDPRAALAYLPGDGELSEASLRALPGLDERRLRFVTPSAHAKLPSHAPAHRLILEALLD
jgi:hypothetical protein